MARVSDVGTPGPLAPIRGAVIIERDLAQRDPIIFNPDLAMSLTNLSRFLTSLDRPEEALTAVQEAIDIQPDLVTQHPTDFNLG